MIYHSSAFSQLAGAAGTPALGFLAGWSAAAAGARFCVAAGISAKGGPTYREAKAAKGGTTYREGGLRTYLQDKLGDEPPKKLGQVIHTHDHNVVAICDPQMIY